MSAPHNPRIVQRAKEMWTEEGLSPQQSIDQLNYEVRENLLNVPKNTAVPADKSSINRWAKAGNWEPHWKEVKAAKNEPAAQEEMSVVEQVLYHLAELPLRGSLYGAPGPSSNLDCSSIRNACRPRPASTNLRQVV